MGSFGDNGSYMHSNMTERGEPPRGSGAPDRCWPVDKMQQQESSSSSTPSICISTGLFGSSRPTIVSASSSFDNAKGIPCRYRIVGYPWLDPSHQLLDGVVHGVGGQFQEQPLRMNI
jgi:hypothetical protein